MTLINRNIFTINEADHLVFKILTDGKYLP